MKKQLIVKWVYAAFLTLGLGLIASGCNSEDDKKTTSEPTSNLGKQTVHADGNISYVDHTDDERMAVAHQGLAEYHTGTGYGNTLFDSADKKCQHCHNQLYDTWKSSMHAKSWSDPVFQSKYQDYLRVQLSKIGTVSSSTYSMKTVTGVDPVGDSSTSDTRVAGGSSKVCLKCHAPGAYYAGDFKITVTKVTSDASLLNATNTTLKAALDANQSNLAGTTGYTQLSATQVAAVATDGNLYTARFHIGHAANREGINCAACHSIETVRMMGLEGTEGVRDGGMYTLKSAIKYGPIGAERFAAGTTLDYNVSASDPEMNGFFSLVGPDMFGNIEATPQTAAGLNDTNLKSADGRFTFRSVEINGTGGDTHYTGGPFYGPYGITGTNNSNDDDDSDRLGTSLGKEVFQAKDNHFSKHAKALCLSCHQRSAGAQDPAASGNQMELCATWSATTGGTDNNWQDTASSPKCTKCHMPRLSDKTVLHKWARPDQLFPREELLTGYFDPEDGDNYGEGHNPILGKWMNDHGFAGGNKLGASNYINKIKSGFEADLTTSVSGTTLEVNTSLQNLTAHMFPGAHPMRRMATRLIVTDSTGAMVNYSAAIGNSTFNNIVNTVVPSNADDTINTTGTGKGSVAVEYENGRQILVSGLQADLDGSAVQGQEFNTTTVTITGADSTVGSQYTEAGVTKGTVKAAAIISDSDTSTFTRLYGRETAKTYSGSYVVRPGFDSNTVVFDNRLTPNEAEHYKVTYSGLTSGTYTVTYKVYYLHKGANGTFPTGTDGWLDDALNAEKKLFIQEVFSESATVTIP